jgi:Putative undecaprenyl diphosphate synthase
VQSALFCREPIIFLFFVRSITLPLLPTISLAPNIFKSIRSLAFYWPISRTDSKQTWQPPASGRLKKCQQTSQFHLLIASGRNFESKMSWIRESTLNWLQMFCVKVVRTGNIPRHVAFIMDGNRRFATKTNVQKVEGHTKG